MKPYNLKLLLLGVGLITGLANLTSQVYDGVIQDNIADYTR